MGVLPGGSTGQGRRGPPGEGPPGRPAHGTCQLLLQCSLQHQHSTRDVDMTQGLQTPVQRLMALEEAVAALPDCDGPVRKPMRAHIHGHCTMATSGVQQVPATLVQVQVIWTQIGRTQIGRTQASRAQASRTQASRAQASKSQGSEACTEPGGVTGGRQALWQSRDVRGCGA